MTQIEIFKQKFDKMVDNIPASVDSGAGYVIDEVYKIVDSLQQEQPKVDLEKEIEEWWQNWASPPRNEFAVFNKKEFIDFARHFAEWGASHARRGTRIQMPFELCAIRK